MKTKSKRGAAARVDRRSPRNPTPRRIKVPVGKWIRQSREASRQGVVPKRVIKCWNCGAENVITGFGNG